MTGNEVKTDDGFADSAIMTVSELIILLKEVLFSPAVIGVTIIIAFYINIVVYVVRYRKKPPRSRKKTKKSTVPEAAPSGAAEEEVEDEDAVPAAKLARKKR